MNRNSLFFYLLLLLLSPTYSWSQENDSTEHRTDTLKKKNLGSYSPGHSQKYIDKGIVIGVHQFHNTFIELGYCLVKGSRSLELLENGFFATSASAEYNPFAKIGGGAITFRSNISILSYGFSVNCIGGLEKKYNPLFGIRPMIGIGGEYFTLSYGYNFFTNKNFDFNTGSINTINKNDFSLRYFIPLKKKILN